MTAEAKSDASRELSAKGAREVERVVQARQDDMREVSRLYSSPMMRIKQTLEIAARVLGFDDPIVESQDLMTGSRLKEIVNFVSGLDFADGDVLVSSHQSCTSILVLWLTGEDVLIPNGSLLAIDVGEPTQGCGKILWQESQNSSEIKRAADFVDQF